MWDSNVILRTINDDRQSPPLSDTETESDNSIRPGDENSPQRKKPRLSDPDGIANESAEDDEDELNDEDTEKATEMVVTVMQLLDPGSVVSMQMSCASLRTLAAQNSSDFALRNIGLARLAKDYAVVHAASNDDAGFPAPRVLRREKREMASVGALVEWFFRAIQNAFVDRLEVDDVPVNEAFAACLTKYAPTVRVRHFSCVKVTLQFQAGVTYPLHGLFSSFESVVAVDLRRSYALLSAVNDDVIAAFTAHPRITSLYLPKSNTQEIGATAVSCKSIIDFCFHQSAPTQNGAARAVRTLDVYAPAVDEHFVQKIIARYYTKQGNTPVALNVHHPIPEQDVEDDENAQIRDDAMKLRIVDDERSHSLQIRVTQGKPPPPRARGSKSAPSVIVAATASGQQ